MLNSKYSITPCLFFPDLPPYVMSFDGVEWRKDFMKKATLGSWYTEMSYYNPKAFYSTLAQTYFIYCQPILLFLLTVWLILLISALWTNEYVRKFGFMTLYSCIDILSLILQDVAFLYVFTLRQNYIQYEMCYLFEMFTQIIPRNLYLISQWAKVGHTFQRYIILSKPIKYRAIFNARSVVTFFIVIIVVSCSLSTVWYLLIDFERVIIIDKTRMETKAICREPGFFSEKDYTKSREYNDIKIANIALSSLLPFICMAFLSIKTVFIIRKQINFRKQFNLSRAAIVMTSERLVKVTIVSTIIFAIFTLPNLPLVIYLYLYMPEDLTTLKTIEYIGVVNSVMFIMNIPVNLLLFSWLSEGFRKSFKKILKQLKRLITN